MQKKFSAIVKGQGLPAFFIIALVITILAVGTYAGGAGGFLAVTGAAEVATNNSSQGAGLTLSGNDTFEDLPVTTLVARETYTATFVYSDNGQDASPADDTYQEDDPVDVGDPGEGVTEPGEEDPDEDEDSDPVQTRISISIEQGEKATGQVDVPDGATVKIGEEPANGTVTVDDDGNWEYTPDDNFSGDDQFTIIVEDEDGVEEIITVEVTVTEAQPDGEEENDVPENEEETLPTSGGVVFAYITALWLFVAASYSLRKGIVGKKL